MPPTIPDYFYTTNPGKRPKKNIQPIVAIFLVVFVSLILLFSYINSLAKAPANFPLNTPIEIKSGTGVSDIAKQLQAENVVRSNLFLYIVLVTNYKPTDIKASTYYFNEPKSVYEIAQTLIKGDFSSNLVKFTHIEGEQSSHIANRASKLLTDFSASEFMALASTSEGRLFPETYMIPLDFTPAQLFKLMLQTYQQNIDPLQIQISASGMSESDILILASIIEREANSVESMKMVSGILQNRLKKGMALQVDASMEYILDKPLKELTSEDLLTDSPYNTYKNSGLPPTAIGNPGLEAIRSVLEPTPSDYYFYITGNDGEFYYSKTFEQHKVNIARHLR